MYFTERDSLEAIVTSKWLELIAEEPAGNDENFFEAGGDSIAAVRFVAALNRALDIRISLRSFLDQPTIRGICAMVRSGGEVRVGRVTAFRTAGMGAPLVVLPGGSGGMSGMSGLHSALFERPTYGVRSLGLAVDEKPLYCVEDIADDLVEELSKCLTTKRFHLAGLCTGGVLAYALASRLLELGWTPLSVVLLDTNLCIPQATVAEYEQERLSELAVAAGLDGPAGADLSVEDFFTAVQGAGLDLVEDNVAVFQQRLTTYAANLRAVAHCALAPIDVPVLLVTCPDRTIYHDNWCVSHAPHADLPDLVGPRLSEMNVETPHSRVLRDARVVSEIESFVAAAERQVCEYAGR